MGRAQGDHMAAHGKPGDVLIRDQLAIKKMQELHPKLYPANKAADEKLRKLTREICSL